jgi:metal-responsive CopG/Arc/MetJ family transcriptional regulator
MRLSPDLKDEVDAWADNQPGKPSRSEALRRLVKLGLAAKAQRRRS